MAISQDLIPQAPSKNRRRLWIGIWVAIAIVCIVAILMASSLSHYWEKFPDIREVRHSSNQNALDGNVTVHITLANKGDRDGMATVEVSIHQDNIGLRTGNMTVFLDAGEEKTVDIAFDHLWGITVDDSSIAVTVYQALL